MKAQKVISIITIIVSLSLIIYMCVMMARDSGGGSILDPTSSNNIVTINTPAPETSDGTSAATQAATPTPAAPTAPISVTAVPGGTTSTNPNYAGKKLIAITFDDGPHATYTPKVLDMLKEKGVHVTFFVLGENLQSSGQRAILKRAFDEGHEIGSHSYNHPDFKTLSSDEITEQLQKTDSAIEAVIGETPILFRPPYGSYNQSVSQQSQKAIVLWSIDSRDWDHISTKSIKNYAAANGVSEEAAKETLINELLFEGFTYTSGGKEYTNPSVVSQLHHGSILLFHDIHPASCDAVSLLIDYLKQSGEYELMTVSQLIETEQRAPMAGDVYAYMWETYATQKKNW